MALAPNISAIVKIEPSHANALRYAVQNDTPMSV